MWLWKVRVSLAADRRPQTPGPMATWPLCGRARRQGHRATSQGAEWTLACPAGRPLPCLPGPSCPGFRASAHPSSPSTAAVGSPSAFTAGSSPDAGAGSASSPPLRSSAGRGPAGAGAALPGGCRRPRSRLRTRRGGAVWPSLFLGALPVHLPRRPPGGLGPAPAPLGSPGRGGLPVTKAQRLGVLPGGQWPGHLSPGAHGWGRPAPSSAPGCQGGEGTPGSLVLLCGPRARCCRNRPSCEPPRLRPFVTAPGEPGTGLFAPWG